MKILRVASAIYPYVLGGIGLHTHDLSSEQSMMGHEVSVYTCPPKSKVSQQSEGTHIFRLYLISYFKRDFQICGNPFSLSLAYAILKNRNNYDIIHAHSHLFFPTNICALARKLGSAPLVITNHGTISQAVPKWLQTLYNHTLSVWTFNAADKIICYTEQAKNEMLNIGVKAEKIMIIHNGIYVEDFLIGNIVKTNPHPRLIWVGRLESGKGLKYMIKGFELFLTSYPFGELLIVGDGIFYAKLNQYVEEKNLSKNIKLMGSVPHEMLPHLYSESDIMVFTSLSEGMPRVIYEAMASGLPIVCTDLPQLIETIPQCGILIPMKDAEKINEALLILSKDPNLRQEFGQRGRDIAIDSYSWKDTAQKTTVLFEEIIHESS